jgi:hypothetical protein
MALALTAGGESRLDGAPDLPLPGYEDLVNAVARSLVEQDVDGVLYGGDPQNAMGDARKYADDYVASQQEATVANRAAAEGRAGQATADRSRQRAAARGVAPESLPADEYGNVPDRTVQEANRPLEDQEAALMQRQDLADEQIRGLREGRRNWAAEQAYQYEDRHGLGVSPSTTGKTDLDYIREQQAHQGFLRTGDGEMIPMGPEPTPESVASRRGFDEWTNESPGSERQATYDPRAYATHREGVRDDIRARAQADAAYYGTGNERQLKDRVQAGDPLAQDLYNRRVERAQSEDRVINSDWQTRRRMERLAMRDHGDPAVARGELDAALAERDKALSPEERFMEQKRRGGNLSRIAEQEDRRARVREQAMLAGGQPTGGPGGTRATTNAINELGPGWREIALLDRLTQGRQGGPTPLGVQAANMELAAPAIRSILAGAAQGMDPAAQANARLAQQLQLAQMTPDQRAGLSIQMQEPIGTGHSASHVNSRWNYWVQGSSPQRERGFRKEMEDLGYQPDEIDAWIESRRAAAPAPKPQPSRGSKGVKPPAPAAPRPGRRRGSR